MVVVVHLAGIGEVGVVTVGAAGASGRDGLLVGLVESAGTRVGSVPNPLFGSSSKGIKSSPMAALTFSMSTSMGSASDISSS